MRTCNSGRLLRRGCLLMLAMLCCHSAARGGERYRTPEESPVFARPKFISLPLTRAYPGIEFNMRPAVTGGTWPYLFALKAAPPGMTIDEQKGILHWQAPKVEGIQFPVTVSAADQSGQAVEQSFVVTVGSADFYFVSPEGDDANPGTFEKPWKTVVRAADAVTNPVQATLYLRSGIYPVVVSAKPNQNSSNVLSITRASPRHWIAWPGEKPVIDLGWSEAQWKAALAAEQAEVDAGRKNVVSTQGYGHRIYLDHQIDGLLFDGLEVKNAAYYMFVMWDGNRSNLTWRRCHLHHLYGDYAENPAFLMTYAPDRQWEKAAPGEDFPFGKRPKAKPYRHMVVQDCTFADRPYDRPRGEHGGGIVWYVTQGCLVEDSRFERIERGQTICDKDSGWDNTYRNNVFLGGFMLAAQGFNDGIHFHHNFVDGTLQIGIQPGWVRNIWIHHNALRGGVALLGGATRGPDKLDPAGKALAGPADPDTQALIRNFPLDQRLIFAWGNVVGLPEPRPGKELPFLDRVPPDRGFAERFRFVYWDGNLVDERAEVVLGWSGKRLKWSDLKPCGFDVTGASGNVVLDAEGRLPASSPWRIRFGRDAVAVMPKP